jgi:hypothetical protein
MTLPLCLAINIYVDVCLISVLLCSPQGKKKQENSKKRSSDILKESGHISVQASAIPACMEFCV